jgi:uncharacterized SAM-binding protein YcdF (DUF218 family)
MVFARLISLLISPLGTALLLGVLSLSLSWRRHHRSAIVSGATAIAWLWLWSTPAASLWIRTYLESQHPALPVAALPDADAIVVLGGAVSPPGARRSDVDLGFAADRVLHAARLYHAGKAPVVVLSGGSDPTVSAISEAEAMQLFLRDLGVPDSAMLLETRSRNTRENARYSAQLLDARKMHHILLVTSALHMDRAMGQFLGQGLDVTPAVTDVEAVPVPADLWRYLPDAGALSSSAGAIKEILGQWLLKFSRHARVRPSYFR